MEKKKSKDEIHLAESNSKSLLKVTQGKNLVVSNGNQKTKNRHLYKLSFKWIL